MWRLIALVLSVIVISTMADDPPTASISSHVLDIARGVPAQNVEVLAYYMENGVWKLIGHTFTQSTGRVPWVSPNFPLVTGTYKLYFNVQKYYNDLNIPSFYPYVEVPFVVKDATQHYHVPLTLSPYGYSTYRGY